MTKKRSVLVEAVRKYAQPPFTELTVGQLLTVTRKLIEDLNEESSYWTLKLFCDWAVHARLQGPKVNTLLQQMDDLFEDRFSKNMPIDGDMPNLLGGFLSFQGFKNELSAFLKRCGVDTPHVLDKQAWEGFEQVYCNIVGDCELIYKKTKKKPLRHLEGAVVSMVRPQFSASQIRYDPMTVRTGIQWTFFKGGKEAFRLMLTFGSKPALRDALPKRSGPDTPAADGPP